MKLKAKKQDKSIVIQSWGNIEFKLFPGSKSNKPYLHFLYLNPATGQTKTVKKLTGLKPGASLAVLKQNGRALADDIITLLEKGWNPISNTLNESPITPLSTVTECMQFWLKSREESLANEAIAPKTLKNNRYVIAYFTTWLKNKGRLHHRPKEFNYLDIDNFFQTTAKVRKWKSKSTYNTYRTDLNTFFSFLITKKIISENPVTLSEKKNAKKDNSRFVIYEEDELADINRLLSNDLAFRQLHIAAKLVFLLNVRPVEITRIQKYNIDLDKKILWLEGFKTKNKNPAKWELTDELYSLLDEYLVNVPEDYFAFGARNKPNKRKTNNDFNGGRWRAFRKKYGISDHLKLYALKHSSDWYDLEDGLPLQKISERNRHANPNVTVAYVNERLNKKIIQPSQNKRF